LPFDSNILKDFKQYFILPAEPEVVYAALTQEATIRLWTGAPVQMVAEPQTEFSLWDGDITGMNLAFEPGRMLQQEWYFGEQDEPSIVTIKLHEHKKGCSLEVNHTNIPEEAFEEISEGWEDVYVAALLDFYSGE